MKKVLLGVLLIFYASSVIAESMSSVLVSRTTSPQFYPAAGSIVASRIMRLGARISGRIAEIVVRPGDIVGANEMLARIDAPELLAIKKQREAELNASLVDEGDARTDAKRLQRLSSNQSISKDDLRNAQVRLSRAKAAVARDRAILSALQVDLNERIIRSPLPVRILQRLQEPGDSVTANMPIIKAEGLAQLRFETYVPLQRMTTLQLGQSVDIQVSGQTYQGIVSHLLLSADSVTRQGKVEIEVSYLEKLMPGQFAVAMLPSEPRNELLIPKSALAQRAGIHCVFVIDTQQKIRLRSIRLGRKQGSHQIVLAGLEEGERIILNPLNDLRDGAIWSNQLSTNE